MAVVRGSLGKVMQTVEGSHDISREYERLCVVSANGISYISKKKVPAGVLLSNDDYWMPLTDDTAAAGAAAAAALNANGAVSYIADVFSSEKDYTIGSYIIHDGRIYRYITDHSAGNFDESEVTEIKVTDEIKDLRDPGVSVNPVYLGDYICVRERYLPSCCVKVGSILYAVDAPNNDWAKAQSSNEGRVLKFDLETNTLVSTKAITTGHANSMTYCPDNNRIYLNPGGVYENGERVSSKFIYEYDTDFNLQQQITIPDTMAMSVTYDHATHKLYVLTMSSEDACKTRYLYEMIGGAFELRGSYDSSEYESGVSGTTNYGYNQDIAIYNSRIYLSSPSGHCMIGTIPEDGSTIVFTKSFIINRADNKLRWRLGETEGWEFDQDGHLICTNYINSNSAYRQAYILEIPTTESETYFPKSDEFEARGSVNLNTQAIDSFYLDNNQIRSLNQLQNLLQLHYLRVVNISLDDEFTELGSVYIKSTIKLVFASGTLECDSITVEGGELIIEASAATGVGLSLTGNSGLFTLRHGGSLSFVGAYSLPISTPNIRTGNSNFIYIGTNNSRIDIYTEPVNSGNIDWNIYKYKVCKGLWYGAKNLTDVPTGDDLVFAPNTTFYGLQVNTTLMLIYFPEDRNNSSGNNNYSITGKLQFRAHFGYLMGTGSDSIIDFSGNVYSYSVTSRSKMLVVLITRVDGGVINNYANIPIVATVPDGQGNLTITKA